MGHGKRIGLAVTRAGCAAGCAAGRAARAAPLRTAGRQKHGRQPHRDLSHQAAHRRGHRRDHHRAQHGDKSEKDFTLHTDQEYLGAALKDKKLVEGTQGQYGLYITTVDGETADKAQQQWWCLTKGGAQVNTGADTTPIADGETYELTLTTGQ